MIIYSCASLLGRGCGGFPCGTPKIGKGEKYVRRMVRAPHAWDIVEVIFALQPGVDLATAVGFIGEERFSFSNSRAGIIKV